MREADHSTPHGETPYSPTSLLRALTADPYSVDTLREDAHPAAEAAPPDVGVTRVITLLLALLLGFAAAVSVLELRRGAAAEDSPRALLEQEVRDTRAEADLLEQRQEELERQIAEAQGVVLDGAETGSSEELGAYEQASGSLPLTGPGVVLVLEDSSPLPSSPGAGAGTVNRVMDSDVQIAVNGLWSAGAEAISVNGQRITSTTAIRTAGSAILVDFRPLSPPYRITALGDPAQLRSAVTESETGEYLAEISSRYGIGSSWESEDELEVPARSVGTLREAAPLDDGSGNLPEEPRPIHPTEPSTAGRGAEEETP